MGSLTNCPRCLRPYRFEEEVEHRCCAVCVRDLFAFNLNDVLEDRQRYRIALQRASDLANAARIDDRKAAGALLVIGSLYDSAASFVKARTGTPAWSATDAALEGK